MVIETKVVIGLLNCPITSCLSDNKLSDNNLASELVGNRSFFKPITIEEIVIFMIIFVVSLQPTTGVKNERKRIVNSLIT